MAWHDYAVDTFRGRYVPKQQLKTQKDGIEWILKTFINDSPIKNSEFVFDFRITRFGGILHTLRHDDEWVIETIGQGKKATYKLVRLPNEEYNLFQ